MFFRFDKESFQSYKNNDNVVKGFLNEDKSTRNKLMSI